MSILKKKDIFIAVYKTRETIFTDQTGKFPQALSQGNNYQMVIHEIDRNSTWVELTKNNMEGEMIKEQRQALLHTKHQGIVPLHHIFDNGI